MSAQEETQKGEPLNAYATDVRVLPPRLEMGGWVFDVFLGNQWGPITLTADQFDSLQAQFIKAQEKQQEAMARIEKRMEAYY